LHAAACTISSVFSRSAQAHSARSGGSRARRKPSRSAGRFPRAGMRSPGDAACVGFLKSHRRPRTLRAPFEFLIAPDFVASTMRCIDQLRGTPFASWSIGMRDRVEVLGPSHRRRIEIGAIGHDNSISLPRGGEWRSRTRVETDARYMSVPRQLTADRAQRKGRQRDRACRGSASSASRLRRRSDRSACHETRPSRRIAPYRRRSRFDGLQAHRAATHGLLRAWCAEGSSPARRRRKFSTRLIREVSIRGE